MTSTAPMSSCTPSSWPSATAGRIAEGSSAGGCWAAGAAGPSISPPGGGRNPCDGSADAPRLGAGAVEVPLPDGDGDGVGSSVAGGTTGGTTTGGSTTGGNTIRGVSSG